MGMGLESARITVNLEGVVQFELSGSLLAENGEQVEEIFERQIAGAVAGEDAADAIPKRVLLSFVIVRMLPVGLSIVFVGQHRFRF